MRGWPVYLAPKTTRPPNREGALMSRGIVPALPARQVRAHRDRHGHRLRARGYSVAEVTDSLDDLLDNSTQHLLHVPCLPQARPGDEWSLTI